MQLDVTLTPSELDRLDRRSHVVAVIDVVRASSTMINGLANGCRAFVPVPSVAAARRTAKVLEPENPMLGGERGGLTVKGFDLGNSPGEYTAGRVRGRTVVFTTTNGTAAITAGAKAKQVIIAGFVNLEAVARYLTAANSDITVAAAGRGSRPALDDTVCAGLIVERVVDLAKGAHELTDGARLALEAARGQRPRIREMLGMAASGRNVTALGLEHDLDFCARLDAFNIVPRVVEGRVVP